MSTDSSNDGQQGENDSSLANVSSIMCEERSEESDSAGSLADFIVSEDESDEEGGEYVATDDDEVTTQSTLLAAELLESLPYDASKSGTVVNSSGLRRSTRARKAPERYVDPVYMKLMLDDVSSMSDDDDDDDVLCDEAYASGDEDYVFDENEAAAMDVDTETDDETDDETDADDEAEEHEAEEHEAEEHEAGHEAEGHEAGHEAEGHEAEHEAEHNGPSRLSDDVRGALADWADA